MARRGLAEHRLEDLVSDPEALAIGLTELSRQMRHELLDGPSMQSTRAADVLANADGYRWLERSGHHIWRSCDYLT